MDAQNLIRFLLDEVQRYYNSCGFSKFDAYSKEILDNVRTTGRNSREATIFLGLIESELARRNRKPDTRVFQIDDSYKAHLQLVLDDNRRIGYIEKGVVIDHLPPNSVFEVVRALKLEEDDSKLSLGRGYASTRVNGGRKAILKIEGRILTDEEVGLIAKIAKGATINTIKDGKVVEKKTTSY